MTLGMTAYLAFFRCIIYLFFEPDLSVFPPEIGKKIKERFVLALYYSALILHSKKKKRKKKKSSLQVRFCLMSYLMAVCHGMLLSTTNHGSDFINLCLSHLTT